MAAEIGAESAWFLYSCLAEVRLFFFLLSGNGLKLSGRSLGWNQLSLHFRSVGLPSFEVLLCVRFCLAKFCSVCS